jgi:hypothetical protein
MSHPGKTPATEAIVCRRYGAGDRDCLPGVGVIVEDEIAADEAGQGTIIRCGEE